MSLGEAGPDYLVLDACVAINLCASGVSLTELAAASGVCFVMTSIAASETLWIGGTAPRDEREMVHFTTTDMMDAISVVDLTDVEVEVFANFARDLDDGEAASVAVAICRKLRVATDDRKAERLLLRTGAQVEVVHTASIIKKWAEWSSCTPAILSTVLEAIQSRATYFPRRDDVHFGWWASATH